MGTIIRVADWFGYSEIYVSNDCVDPYNPKVVQSTMGSLSRVSVVEANLNFLEMKMQEGYALVCADMEGRDLTKFTFPEKHILIMGNEGSGIRSEILQLSHQKVTIPRAKESSAESLNVAIATSILLSFIKLK